MSEAVVQVVVLMHAFATLAMCGLCWFVQVVHYPLFAHVGEDRFTRYENEHVRRTTWIVAPLMLVELATAGMLAAPGLLWESGSALVLSWVGAGLLALVWLSTFGMQVPLHARLQRAYSSETVRALVLSNWPRTILWTARGVIALLLVWCGGGMDAAA